MNNITIYHDPSGRQHPYEYAPFERQPYRPTDNEPVKFGVVTRPAGAVQTLRAEWRRANSVEITVTAAKLKSENESEAHWLVEQPPCEAGETVEYRFVASNIRGDKTSPTFSFVVGRWVTAKLAAAPIKRKNGLSATYELPGTARAMPLEIEYHRGRVTLTWGESAQHGEESEEENGVRADYTEAGLLEIRRADGETILAEAQPPQFLVYGGEPPSKARMFYTPAGDEAFFGFGERYNSLDFRGRRVDTRVFDQFTNQGERTYLPVPFFLSSRGYGYFIDSTRWSAFDLAASEADCWTCEAELSERAGLRLEVFTDAEIKNNLTAFSQMLGLPPMPPEWAFGLWMSSNDWDSQAKVMEQVRLAREHDIPASVMVIEAWSDEINFYIWNDAKYKSRRPEEAFHLSDFEFEPAGRWPDPKGMIDELHAEGMELVLWQIPVLKDPTEPEIQNNEQHRVDEKHMIEQGYCVKNSDGTAYRVRPGWFRNSLLMDFTNAAANEWWFNKRRYLVEEMGVAGFKTDGGEHIWGREMVFADGRNAAEVWNEYPALYQQAYAEFVRSIRGGDTLLFSRAGYTGAQRFTTHWAGDAVSTWEAYRAAILAMLNAGMSGQPFIGWDLAGFAKELPTAELYLRSAAAAVFCPIMQYHSDYWRGTPTRDRTPWNIQEISGDERVIPLFRNFVQLREKLRPYIQRSAEISARTGLPMMRAMPLEFPADVEARGYPYQYMFGEDLLVAPVTEPGVETAPVYLPEGKWRDFFSGEKFSGPRVLHVRCALDTIPVYERIK